MLRLVAAQAETLWDEALPIEVRELPADLAALDALLSGPGLLAPFTACWQREALVSGSSSADLGRPTIAIETYVRLMVLKARYATNSLHPHRVLHGANEVLLASGRQRGSCRGGVLIRVVSRGRGG
jgi:hypothetical protein